MNMNPAIILSGKQPDIANALLKGTQAASMANASDQRNALFPLEQQAAQQRLDMNALNMDNTRQMMGIRGQQESRAAANFSREQEVARVLEQNRKVVGIMRSAQTPEQWDQLARTYGDTELVGQFGNKQMLLNQLLEQEQILAMEIEAEQPASPQSPAGKLAADLRAGLISQEAFDRATAPKAPLVQNIIGGEGGMDTPDGPGFVPTTDDLPDGAGRSSFGFGGAVRNSANAVSDFVTGTEVFPETGEATRYFRDLEENGLVGIAQAYPRMPAAQLMERLRKLLPNVGTIEGAQAAYRELVQMQSRFERDLKNATRMQGRGTAAAQAETARRILALQGLAEQTAEGIRLLQPDQPADGNSGKTGSGISWSVEQ